MSASGLAILGPGGALPRPRLRGADSLLSTLHGHERLPARRAQDGLIPQPLLRVGAADGDLELAALLPIGERVLGPDLTTRHNLAYRTGAAGMRSGPRPVRRPADRR